MSTIHSPSSESVARDERTAAELLLELRNASEARRTDASEAIIVALQERMSGQLRQRLMRYAQQRLQSPNPELDAEQALQAGLVRVWESIDFYDPERGKAEGWLWSIVYHSLVDARRKHIRQEGREMDEDAAQLSLREVPDSRPDAEACLAATEDYAAFRKQIAAVPYAWKRTVLCALDMALRLGGMPSNTEIATALNLPIATVGTDLCRFRTWCEKEGVTA